MVKNILTRMALLCAVSVIPLNAASVSVVVIETGLANTNPRSSQSVMWENGLMDVLFDSGHIVTNSPIIRMPALPDEEFPSVAERDFNAAKEGGMRYIIVAIVSHPSPHHVTLRLFSTDTGEMLFEQAYADRPGRTDSAEYERVKNDIRAFAASIR